MRSDRSTSDRSRQVFPFSHRIGVDKAEKDQICFEDAMAFKYYVHSCGGTLQFAMHNIRAYSLCLDCISAVATVTPCRSHNVRVMVDDQQEVEAISLHSTKLQIEK